MNICHDHEFILWALPRTASRFIYASIKNLGSMPPLTHRVGMPSEYAHYSVVCSVRNPYTRVLSAWKWMNAVGNDEYFPESFPEFVQQHIPTRGIRPITEELGQLRERVTYLVRTESVMGDLRKLPWVPDNHTFPKGNYQSAYAGGSPPDFYDKGSQETVRSLYINDFKEFAYDPDVIPDEFEWVRTCR